VTDSDVLIEQSRRAIDSAQATIARVKGGVPRSSTQDRVSEGSGPTYTHRHQERRTSLPISPYRPAKTTMRYNSHVIRRGACSEAAIIAAMFALGDRVRVRVVTVEWRRTSLVRGMTAPRSLSALKSSWPKSWLESSGTRHHSGSGSA